MRTTLITSTLLILATSFLTMACATTPARPLGDGEGPRLGYSDKADELVKNDWAEVTQLTTAFASEPDKQFDIPFWWQFGLKVKIDNLKSVSIYDLSAAQPRLLFSETGLPISTGNWSGRTAPEKFSRDVAPWFFSSGTTEHIFKIVLTSTGNEERILFQLCRHNEATKKNRVAEIIKLTAPDIKFKPHRAQAPRQNPTEFSVVLPKRPPAPTRSYEIAGNKNMQTVGVTIRPKGEPD